MRIRRMFRSRVFVGSMALLFVLESQVFAVTNGVPGLFGVGINENVALRDVDNNGLPTGANEDSSFSSIYVNCRLHKVVVSASGRVNNQTTQPHRPVILINHPDVNGPALFSIENIIFNFCPDYGGVNFEFSKYVVSPDRTPMIGDDLRALGALTYIACFNTQEQNQ
jgi:hypothetical protein